MKKINILLGILLAAVIGLGTFVTYRVIKDNGSVTVPDFLGKNKQEVFNWCGSLDPKYSCVIEYEESTSIEKDYVFYQSVNSGMKLKDQLTIKISNGIVELIQLPVLNENTSKTAIEKWITDNGLTAVTFVEEKSESVKKGNVIRIEAPEEIKKDTEIIVYVSKGTEDEKRSIEVKSGEYVNLTVSQFETKAKELGLRANHNTARDDFSSSIAEGKIVWHGSGTYEEGETFNYGISLGNKADRIIVQAGDYIGKTENEFITIAGNLGLNPNHNKERDDYSDTVTKGRIVWHGSGTYEKDETFNYGLSLGKKNSQESDGDEEIVITKGQYVGKTVKEFENVVKALSLDPYHDPTKDEYSDSVELGNIVWHGSGTYETNERIRYGLSLGKKSTDGKVMVSSGYEGKSESEFRQYIISLGLVPNKAEEEYSDSYPKGTIISYISGEYNQGNSVSYKLSLGKKDAQEQTITITKGQYVGKSVDEFESSVKALTLDPYHDPSKDEYSDTVPQGKIVWHGSGEYETNEKIRYGLSLGANQEEATAYIMRPNYYEAGETFQQTKEKIQNYLSAFTDLTFVETTSDLRVGMIVKITVNGNESYTAGNYPISTPIKVYIVSKQTN
ncbi:MAG: hypothetical protein IJI44_02770 [Erysipelotrichaceae bacterium]|nr:hypothetical protein [Erysipelotrichaceae bacterium]